MPRVVGFSKALLGSPYDDNKTKPGPIFDVPMEDLISWGREQPDDGPRFLMSIAPLFEAADVSLEAADEKRWHPIVDALLREFGDRDDVLSALSRNMHTFGWWGSAVPYIEQYEEPLQSLLQHPQRRVREWARRELQHMQQWAKRERSSDEERELGIW